MTTKTKKKRIIDKSGYIKCEKCGEVYAPTNFYNSKSILCPDGKVHVCKKCIMKMLNYDDINTIYSVFQILDIPFFYDKWEDACEKNPGNPFGRYVRIANSGLNEFKGLSYKDSVFEPTVEVEPKKEIKKKDVKKDINKKYKPTKEVLLRWGTSLETNQYIKLERFYNEMKEKNNIVTPQDEDYLKKLAMISMKMDEELVKGNYTQAKQLGELFSKYMADSKFRATDKTDADKTGGVKTFSSIYAEVEKDGFIPPWSYYAKLKGVTQDIVDKTIMHIENFTLRLNKAPKMVTPPSDTPKILQEETDVDLNEDEDDDEL